jgi:hypothetical protein
LGSRFGSGMGLVFAAAILLVMNLPR